jgi:membrane protein DedA with SNARE-associated domain
VTLGYIQTIGYPMMFLLMILEGPITTLAAAFLSSLGFFNIYIVFFLSLLGDLISDIFLYLVGYFGGTKILTKIEKLLHKNSGLIEKMKKHFAAHGQRTIFAVKSTTGLCMITFITAGAVRMNLKKFLLGSFWGGIVWSLFLVVTGYFFGYAFERITEYLRWAGFFVISGLIVFYLIVFIYKKHLNKKIFENGEVNS